MQKLLEVFPFIHKTMIDLEQQNKFLSKVTLVGKINALHVAANLFEFTDKTALVFDELKVELIEALLNENLNKITNELAFKAKTAIDILIRNLFERTADIGFFATDTLIKTYLTEASISDERMLTHLQEYASKYSVYNEILIFDLDGNVKINLNSENTISSTQDSIIKEALECDEYIERFSATDIFKAQDKTLLYVQKIVHNGHSIGVLCLCFKFEDEMKSIFKNLANKNEIISLSIKGEVLAINLASNSFKKMTYTDKKYRILQNRYIAVDKKTSGYQGYNGIDGLYATAIEDTNNLSLINESKEELQNVKSSNLLNDNLRIIIEKANDIVEDISDVIINGELIASKQKVYVLTPILDNLRKISSALLNSIKSSLKNLEFVVEEGLVHDVKMASHLAIDIMDRNLYERANDSRWWALTPLFIKELSSAQPNTNELHKTLLYINNLYTVYTNIFIYDKNQKIIASSLDESIVGEVLQKEYISQTLHNQDSQKYYVSPFEKTPFYDNRATYIYSASIHKKGDVLGGIAVVFDAQPEFKAMLDDSFPQTKKGFMFFVDKERKIIASNHPTLKVLSTLDIDEKFVNVQGTHSIFEYITFEGVKYIVASVLSQGYREYKTEDNYVNTLYCITFVRL